MAKAARDHVIDSNKNNIFGHTGSDGSTLSVRINRYSSRRGALAENIDYGTKSPLEVIIALLVDDGVASRGHRTNMFNPMYTKVGMATAGHPRWGQSTVMDYSSK